MTDEIKDISLINAGEAGLDQVNQELDLDKARVILQAIASTPEDRITSNNLHPLEYSPDLARKAISVYAQSLAGNTSGNWFSLIDKNTPQGKLQFFIAYDEEENRSNPDKISLQLVKDHKVVIDSKFRPTRPKYVSDKYWHFYRDSRIDREVNQASLEENLQIDDYKFLWRGLRWMAANMLHW